MSLLLDALKRAEQEKLARQGQEPRAAEGAGEIAPDKTPRRPLELESRDGGPADEPVAARREREGAKAVFAAKKPEPAPAPGGSGNKLVLVVVGVAVLLVAAGGAYVWYEINGTPRGLARGPLPAVAPRPVTPAAVAAAPRTAPAAPAAPAAAGTPSAPLAAMAMDDPARSTPPAPALRAPAPAPAPAPAKSGTTDSAKLVASLVGEPPAARPAPALKVTSSVETPRVSPEVLAGYRALLAGDAAGARRHYETAVKADASNVDAQLGLAASAARLGDPAAARSHYRAALALDPRNPSAIAGLAAIADLSRPDAVEGELRADLSRFPHSAALHFTLGNLYASQARWTEAQAAYFEAYRLEPGGADLAYNLAVSLDHLGQARLAADFYRRALEASRGQGTQFDRSQVSRRLAELKP